jgi:hypothetical protein
LIGNISIYSLCTKRKDPEFFKYLAQKFVDNETGTSEAGFMMLVLLMPTNYTESEDGVIE